MWVGLRGVFSDPVRSPKVAASSLPRPRAVPWHPLPPPRRRSRSHGARARERESEMRAQRTHPRLEHHVVRADRANAIQPPVPNAHPEEKKTRHREGSQSIRIGPQVVSLVWTSRVRAVHDSDSGRPTKASAPFEPSSRREPRPTLPLEEGARSGRRTSPKLFRVSPPPSSAGTSDRRKKDFRRLCVERCQTCGATWYPSQRAARARAYGSRRLSIMRLIRGFRPYFSPSSGLLFPEQ